MENERKKNSISITIYAKKRLVALSIHLPIDSVYVDFRFSSYFFFFFQFVYLRKRIIPKSWATALYTGTHKSFFSFFFLFNFYHPFEMVLCRSSNIHRPTFTLCYSFVRIVFFLSTKAASMCLLAFLLLNVFVFENFQWDDDAAHTSTNDHGFL